MILANKEHYASLKLIKENLESKGIPYQRIYMPYTAYEEFKDRDLVICVGGDGTVLNSVRYILNSTPVLTVKSESTSVGGLCVINSSQFEDTLNKVLNDDYRIELRTRAVASLDNMTDLALNDVAIKPYFGGGFVRYEVNFKGIKEKLSGSGMIVSTGSGAPAWYQKIHGSDQEFNKKDNMLKWIAEAYDLSKNYYKYKLSKGTIMPGETLEITSMNENGEVVIFDGNTERRMHRFRIGHVVRIDISDKPVHMVTVNNNKNYDNKDSGYTNGDNYDALGI